jgi:DNA-binding NarL/FixJ family response regulator
MKNMEKTFILGNSESMKELGGIFIEIPNLINEVDTHNWLIRLFRNNEINKVVIEIGENPLLSLQIGYHIRLSIENIKNSALVPILYVSKLLLNSIMHQTGIYSQILATKCVSFSEFDLKSNKLEIEHLKGLNESDYLMKFLKVIHIQPDETVGRHSLANIWGASAMDKAGKVNALSDDSEFKKKLYFKYVSAFNSMDHLKPSQQKVIEVNKRMVNANFKILGSINKPKRILLIDDEASNGWETVLRKVFKASAGKDFVVINEKVKDFEAFSEANKRIINSEKFDLYLVDLRLNGLDEDENLKTEDFSGMKVLRKIKSLNKGNQVIVFTASNKVWNLKALLDAGADAYYMKESPEYNFSNAISTQNYKDFKANVAKCFERSYLREIYIEWENTKSVKNNTVRHFIAESDAALDISWELIKRNYLNFGFLTLFQSIENIANKLYSIDDYNDSLEGEKTIDKTVGEGAEWEWLMSFNADKRNGSYFTLGKSIQNSTTKPTALYKVSCLFKIKYQKEDAFLKEIGKLNKLRNDIAHGDTRNSATKKDLVEILKILSIIRNS